MGNIKTIPPKLVEQKKKKVAAYCRVSVQSEMMDHSLSAQISYYNNLIQRNPEWEFAGIYYDNGISGTQTENRKGFQQMLEDIRFGKIDLILTKSITRFARNTVDLLSTVRWMKEAGVAVQFEKENINTMTGDGELMLSILASFAQAESESISENVKWGTVERYKKGLSNGRYKLYGYEWKEDKLVPIPDQAEAIRFMFDKTIEGMSVSQIAEALNEQGLKTRRGFPFDHSKVTYILRNITYTGNMLFQRYYVEDPIGKRIKKNQGEHTQYLVENSHEPIVTKETFDKVQAILDEKSKNRQKIRGRNDSMDLHGFKGRTYCGKCGSPVLKKGVKRNEDGTPECWYYRCSKGSQCGCRSFRSDILETLAKEAMGKSTFNRNYFQKSVRKMILHPDDTVEFIMADNKSVLKNYDRPVSGKVYTHGS